MVSNILVVEDDKGVQKYLRELLLDNGYSVQTASDGHTALELAKKSEPDLVILDLGLPDMTGESVCLKIREAHPDLPVVILTARDAASDMVKGLNLGADDYMTKPFDADVLLARIRARLRLKAGDVLLKVGDLVLNPQTYEVCRGTREVKLTPQEYKLLEYFMSNKNRILTRDMILSRIWSSSQDIETRVVDVYVGYLRKKIDKGFKKKLIQSARGFGYILKG